MRGGITTGGAQSGNAAPHVVSPAPVVSAATFADYRARRLAPVTEEALASAFHTWIAECAGGTSKGSHDGGSLRAFPV